MLKITLIHCYSDQNRGDAGIIEGTIDLIQATDPSCDVEAISVFHEDDDRYNNEHYFTGKIIKKIHPALFHEPNIQRNNKSYSLLRKTFLFIKLLFVNFILFLLPYRPLARVLLSQQRYQTFTRLLDTDVVISKGGSFLYSHKGINGDFFLFRMLFAFLLPIRLGKKVGIFSQSIGPFENKISQHLLFYIFKKLDFIYLRESKCLKFLPTKLHNLTKTIPDSAFFLSYEEMNLVLSERPKIAITARPHKFSDDKEIQKLMYGNYMSALKAMASYCISIGYEIHLIGQVTGPSYNEDDRNALAILRDMLVLEKGKVIFWDENEELLSPKKLQYLYSKMKVVIGTRLHSTIFSLAANTPSINISYHGTKSQGIMDSVGLGEFVLDINNIKADEGISMLDKIFNDESYKTHLITEVNLQRESLKYAMSNILALHK